jgi:hypothetical protein
MQNWKLTGIKKFKTPTTTTPTLVSITHTLQWNIKGEKKDVTTKLI